MALNRDEPERDPALDRAYAFGEREEPPSRLDDAIRAAARREVGARPGGRGGSRRAWQVALGLAAVLVLSVTLVTLMKEEGADQFETSPVETPAAPQGASKSDVPASTTSPGTYGYLEPTERPQAAAEPKDKPAQPARAAAPSAAPQNRDASTAAREDRAREVESMLSKVPSSPAAVEERRTQPEAPPPPDTDRSRPGLASPFPLPAKPEQEAVSKRTEQGAGIMRTDPGGGTGVSSSGNFAAARESAAPRAAPAPPPAAKAAPERAPVAAQRATVAPVWAGLEREPPQKWIERIEELRRAGRESDARELLDEFRKRFPAYPLPPTLAQ